MKNILKHTVLAMSCLTLIVGCNKKENLNLDGYPENKINLSFAEQGNSSGGTVLNAEYNINGELELKSELKLSEFFTRTYDIELATPSPKDVKIVIEPLIVNVPAEHISISNKEIIIKAGYSKATVTVNYASDDFDFMSSNLDATMHELGIKIVSVDGYQMNDWDSQAKVIVSKESYNPIISIEDEAGRTASFIRICINGVIINKDPIAYTFKANLDKPAQKDIKVSFTTLGLDEKFAKDVTFSPEYIVIPAGSIVSPPITWSVTDDFMLANQDVKQHTLTLKGSFESEDNRVAVLDESHMNLTMNITNSNNYLSLGSGINPSWTMFDRSGWTANNDDASEDYGSIIDGNMNTYIYSIDGPLSVIIDMKERREMAGFALRYGWNTEDYSSSRIELYSSDDGTNWNDIGYLEPPSQGEHYIDLAATIQARYLKAILSPYGMLVISEFEVYGIKKETNNLH